MDEALADRSVVPPREGDPRLGASAARSLLVELEAGWELVDGHHLVRTWTFPDFASGLRFVDRVGAAAEELGHHPDVYLAWGRVRLELWSHVLDGLHLADFVLAARCEREARDDGAD